MNLKNALLTVVILLMCINLSFAKTDSKDISNTVNSLMVSIDSRQELLSIVQYLGGYFQLNKLNLDYKTDIDIYFSDYKEHETVKFVQELTKKGFTYDAPPASMLRFNDDFEVDKAFTAYLVKRAGGEDNINKFASLMKQFADDTNFKQFLDSQSDFYTETVNDFSNLLLDFKEVETIEGFYGKKQNSYNIILSILNAGNYGPSVNTNGKVDIYNIMSAKKEKDGQPLFGGLKNVEYLVWHEFGHSFVNPLTKEHKKLVANYKALHAPIKAPMQNQAYRNWETVINEHIIRAVTIILAENKYGKDAATFLKNQEIGRSFYYIEPLLEQLDIYQQNRDKYASFAEFYPVLIVNAFNKAQSHNYQEKYLKNLNNTYKDIDFVVISENAPAEVSDFVKGIKAKFFKNTPLITDKEAIEKDLSQHSFLVYGTIENNLFLQKIKVNLPIEISDSSIKADKEYITQDGKAIFNMSNPLNHEEYIIVYTAQKPSGIVNINNVFHGPTNYIVFENRKKVFKKGFLIKENDKWICK